MAAINRTEYAVLGLLAMGARTGYDIKKMVEETIGHFWNESFGHIYPVLKRLHERGWVSKTTEVVQGRNRNVYALTAEGEAALQAWFKEPVAPTPLRNELLLKLFFGRFAQPEDLIAQIQAHRQRQQAGWVQLQQILDQLPAEAELSPHLLYWRLTLRMGVHVTQALMQWGDEALALLGPLTSDTQTDEEE